MKRVSLIGVIAFSAALLVQPTAWAQTDSGGGGDEVSTAREFMIRWGVDPQVAEVLLARLSRGDLPDAETGLVKPISTSKRAVGDEIVIISTYPDGSIAVTEGPNLEAKKRAAALPEPQGSSTSGCKYKGSLYGGYWTDCAAKGSTMTLDLAFRFDYENVRGRGSAITRQWGAEHNARAGTFASAKFETPYRNVVRYAGVYAAWNNMHSASRYLQVSTSGSAVSSEMN